MRAINPSAAPMAMPAMAPDARCLEGSDEFVSLRGLSRGTWKTEYKASVANPA